MKREIVKTVTGFRTTDGAGVSLVRVLGSSSTKVYDPILMLDSFDSTNPDDYTAGFPVHPHRGIETISYVYRGKMLHRDSLGNEDQVTDGEVQWMTAGSGILHEEMIPAADRMLGVQLWLNLPAKEKMCAPAYHAVRNADIEEIPFEGGKVRLLAGNYGDHQGYQGMHLPFDYYDIYLEPGASITVPTEHDKSVMLFTLLGNVKVNGAKIAEKTAVKLSEGDEVEIASAGEFSQVLFMGSTAIKEPVAWAGPIVMNTHDEVRKAYDDLNKGIFLSEGIEY